jgi:hypothetical protein
MTTPPHPWQPDPRPPVTKEERDAILKAFDVCLPPTRPTATTVAMDEEDRRAAECPCGGPAGHVPGGIWCRK